MLFLVAIKKKSATIPAQTKHMARYNIPIKTRRAGERDGILFWILPPLLLGAVFAFCSSVKNTDAEAGDKTPAAEVSTEE